MRMEEQSENSKMRNEVLQIAAIFRNLGANEKKAITMSRQLVKRSEQLSIERKSSQVEELRKLLEVAILGAKGETKPPE